MVTEPKTSVAIAVTFLFLLAPAAAQDESAPTPEEERDLAVKLTVFLENNPFHDKAKEARSWFTIWLVEVPDITVRACGSFHGPYLKKSKKYSSELFVQMLYGQAAFIIENPDHAADDFAVYRAGLTSSLRLYRSILTAKPKARDKYLDDLVGKLESGGIDEYVLAKMQECQ